MKVLYNNIIQPLLMFFQILQMSLFICDSNPDKWRTTTHINCLILSAFSLPPSLHHGVASPPHLFVFIVPPWALLPLPLPLCFNFFLCLVWVLIDALVIENKTCFSIKSTIRQSDVVFAMHKGYGVVVFLEIDRGGLYERCLGHEWWKRDEERRKNDANV